MKNKSTPDQGRKPEGERIAKRLARAGVASRRDAEAMVEAGRVKVNGRVLKSPAFNVQASDRIEVDGAPIPEVERTRLFLFHKPSGVVTTSRDPEGRKTVYDLLPSGLPRLVTIGRLDINTEGLLLLTNDGGLARVLELPSTGWLRRYRVRVHGTVDPLALAELEKGIAVDGVFYGSIEATLDRKQGSNAWLSIGLREGKNREVKNVLGSLGLDVTRLIRVSYGPFQLGSLEEGAVQEIKGRMLRDQLGPRLIEEAGADFDAPIARPFSNKPAPAGKPAEARPPKREEERRPDRWKKREDRREEMRDRLQTRPPARPGRPADSQGRKGEQRSERSFGKKREDKPESARDRFQTRPPTRPGRPAEGQERKGDQRSERSFGKKREDKPEGSRDRAHGKPSERPGKGGGPMERRSRASNVWMAPGARPVGKKKAEEAASAAERKGGARKEGKGGGAKGGKPPARPPAGGSPRPGKGRRDP